MMKIVNQNKVIWRNFFKLENKLKKLVRKKVGNI